MNYSYGSWKFFYVIAACISWVFARAAEKCSNSTFEIASANVVKRNCECFQKSARTKKVGLNAGVVRVIVVRRIWNSMTQFFRWHYAKNTVERKQISLDENEKDCISFSQTTFADFRSAFETFQTLRCFWCGPWRKQQSVCCQKVLFGNTCCSFGLHSFHSSTCFVALSSVAKTSRLHILKINFCVVRNFTMRKMRILWKRCHQRYPRREPRR